MTIAFAMWGWGLAGAILGAIAGSYLATIVIRWPRGEAARGRSMCDGCGRVLRSGELVPLLSFLVARGRCGACGGRIDPRHPVIELLCAGVGALTLALAPGAAGLAGALFGWLLVALAVLDRDHLWLPDRLTGTLAVLGCGAGLAGLPPPLADRLIGGIAGYAAPALIAIGYRAVRGREGLGQGDAKLLGAIGLWLGWQALPLVLLGASLVGLAGILVLYLVGRKVAADTRLPFGALLGPAAFVMWMACAGGLSPI